MQVKYTGSQNFNEYYVTGRIVTWTPNQVFSVPDAIGQQLIVLDDFYDFYNIDSTNYQGGVSVTLGDLTLSASEFQDDVLEDSLIATISGKTSGSVLSTPDERFTVDGTDLLRGSGAVTAGSTSVDIVETLSGATNNPKTNNLALTITEEKPLRFVTQNNIISRSFDARPGKNACVVRLEHIVGSGAIDSITLSFCNQYFEGSTSLVQNTPEKTVSGSVEYNGVAVPFTFSSSSTGTMLTTTNDLKTDPIPASAFGVASIPVGASIFTKHNMTFAAGSAVPLGDKDRRAGTAGVQNVLYYDSASTTITNLNDTGVITYTGDAPEQRVLCPSPFILGTFVSGDPLVPVFCGDSITQGTGDTRSTGTSSDIRGAGWPRRVLDDLLNESPTAGCTLGISGAVSLIAQTSEYQEFFQYANMGIFNFGTNDFGSSSGIDAATMYTRANSVLSAFTSAGITVKGISKVTPRATSTDSWVTLANQTPLTRWDDPTDDPMVYNDGVAANTSADFVLPHADVRNGYKWVTDESTANYTASDDTHPSNNGNAIMAAEAKTLILAAAGL